MTTNGGMVRSSSCTSFIQEENYFLQYNHQSQLLQEDYALLSANADNLKSSWVIYFNSDIFLMELSSFSTVEQQQQYQQQT